MSKSIISEGKTTNEAIENGLKELKVSKNMVDIKVIENEEKRSFFSILAPRVVKVELTVKENTDKSYKEKEEISASKDDIEKAKKNIEEFIEEFIHKLGKIVDNDLKYEIKEEQIGIDVQIIGQNTGYLI